MRPARSKSVVLPALTLITLGLGAGCRTPPPVYVVEAEPEAICVPEAPPPPMLEVPPAPPDESAIWQPGYWHWGGGGYDWVAGYWVEPRPGYVYIEASYVYVDGGWRYRPPYWRHHRHRRRWHHRGRPGHDGPPDAVAMPAPPVRDGSAGTTAHRAPPAPDGPTVHRAPPAPDGPAVHRAPPAPDLPDPDATAGLPDTRGPEQPQVVRIPDEAVVDVDPEPKAMRAEIVPPERAYRHLPEYRGVHDGRLVFEQQQAERFRTDRTGAIVLAADPGEPRRPRRGGIVVHRPEPRPALEHPMHPHVPVVNRPRFVERPHHPRPRVIHVPPPRMHRPAPAPRMHRPAPRMHRPAPRMHRSAPRRHARR